MFKILGKKTLNNVVSFKIVLHWFLAQWTTQLQNINNHQHAKAVLMKTKDSLVYLALILLTAGCQTDQPAPVVDLAPLTTQIGRLSTANSDLSAANAHLTQTNAELNAANEHLKAVLRADADAGTAANTKGWLPFEKYVWGHQIALLPGAPDKDTTDKWTEASGLYAKGGESAMLGVINDLTTQAGQLNTKMGELTKAAQVAQAERDKAQDAADKALQQAKDATATLAAAVAKAKADEAARLAAETRAWQVKVVSWTGGILFIATIALAACCFLLPVAVTIFKKAAFVAGMGCAACFAMARFLSSPWFDIAWKVTAGALIVAGIGWAAWELRQAIKRSQVAKVTAANELAVKPIITTLDTAYDAADAEHQAWMDAQIFEVLGKEGAQYSAAIHEIKASITLEKTLKT